MFSNRIVKSSSSSCAIPETGVGASLHIPVLSVCFSCFYTGIRNLIFNAGFERLVREVTRQLYTWQFAIAFQAEAAQISNCREYASNWST